MSRPEKYAIHSVELADSSSPQPWPRGSSRGRGLAYGCLLMVVSRVGAADGCDNFNSVTCDMKIDNVITLTITPDSGTAVALNGKDLGTIDGEDFGRGLLLVWLGDQPPSASVKDGLLGK